MRENVKHCAVNPGTVTTFTYHPDGLKFTEDVGGEKLTTIVWDGTEYLEVRD